MVQLLSNVLGYSRFVEAELLLYSPRNVRNCLYINLKTSKLKVTTNISNYHSYQISQFPALDYGRKNTLGLKCKSITEKR